MDAPTSPQTESKTPLWLILVVIGCLLAGLASAGLAIYAFVDYGGKLREFADTGGGVLQARSQAMERIIQSVKPSVVSVHVAAANGIAERFGSGTIVSGDGYILTSKLLLQSGGQVTVTTDAGEIFTNVPTADIDGTHDLALLKISGAAGLPAIVIDAVSEILVGMPVWAIGNNASVHHNTVTEGNIAALGRNITTIDALGNQLSFTNLFQIDAVVSTDGLGGPLIDNSGQVIGVNSFFETQAQLVSFATPMTIAKDFFVAAQNKAAGAR